MRFKQLLRSSGVIIGILALNAFLGMEVVGLTYRPFSWTTICEDQDDPLYPPVYPPGGGDDGEGGGSGGGGGVTPPPSVLYVPVIHGMQTSNRTVSISVQGEVGTEIVLERTTSLGAPDWQPVGDAVFNLGGMIQLFDTNSPRPAAFYRASQNVP